MFESCGLPPDDHEHHQQHHHHQGERAREQEEDHLFIAFTTWEFSVSFYAEHASDFFHFMASVVKDEGRANLEDDSNEDEDDINDKKAGWLLMNTREPEEGNNQSESSNTNGDTSKI